jgi:hypothetical protein
MHEQSLNKHVSNWPDVNCLTPRNINDGLAIQIHMTRHNKKGHKDT